MSELDERLAKCLSAVLPALPRAQMAGASNTTTKGWDSLATVTLVSLVEEEFGLQVPFEDLENFLSFAGMRDYLQRQAGAK